MVTRCLAILLLLAFVALPALAQPESFVVRLVGDGFEGLYIMEVPDASQPPPNPLGYRSVDNWCAPLAAANALFFLDRVAGAEWALKVSGGLSPDDLSVYLGYFMTTNGEGSAERVNAASQRPGTLNADIAPGLIEFAEWHGEPPPGLVWKERYPWRVDFLGSDAGDEALLEAYAASIETGIPVVLCLAFWNPVAPTALTLSSSTSTRDAVPIAFYAWGDPITSTTDLRKENPKTPDESWDGKCGIGHAVTGVGFLKDRERFWVIVHDNWSTTVMDVAIPWEYVSALIRFLPG